MGAFDDLPDAAAGSAGSAGAGAFDDLPDAKSSGDPARQELNRWVTPSTAGAGRGNMRPPDPEPSVLDRVVSGVKKLADPETYRLARTPEQDAQNAEEVRKLRGINPLDTVPTGTPTAPVAPVDPKMAASMKAELGAMPRAERLKANALPGWKGQTAQALNDQLDAEQGGADSLKMSAVSPTLEGRAGHFAAKGADHGTATALARQDMQRGQAGTSMASATQDAEPSALQSALDATNRKPMDHSVGGAALETAGDAARGIVRAGQGLVGDAWSGVRAASDMALGPDSDLSQVAKGAADIAHQDQARYQSPDPNSVTQQIFESTFTNVPMMVGFGFGNRALAAMGAQSAAQSYGEARDAGYSVQDSSERGLWHGLAEVLGEKFSLPVLGNLFTKAVSNVSTKEMGHVLAELLVKEQLGEQVTTALQDGYDKVGKGGTRHDMTLGDYLDDAVNTAKVTLGQSLLMGGAAHVAHAATSSAAADQAPAPSALEMAKAKGFLVNPPLTTDTPSTQRKKLGGMFQDLAAKYGLPKEAMDAAIQQADGRPLSDLGGFYQRVAAAFQKRGLFAEPVHPDVMGVFDNPHDAEQEKQAAQQQAAPSQRTEPTGDFSGLAEPEQVDEQDATAVEAQPAGDQAAAGEAEQPGAFDDLPTAAAAQDEGELSILPDSILSHFPDAIVSDAGLIGLNNFTSSEQEALRRAGLVVSREDEDGQPFDGVDPEDLWIERLRRAEVNSNNRKAVTDDERNAGIERRAKNYDRAAEEQEALGELGDQGLAKGFRSKAESIRKSRVLDQAANQAATSPLNDKPQPTEAQKEAGNYAKGHVTVQGLGIAVENPRGSTRSGTSPEGMKWETTMQHHYGYIKGTVGNDKDHVDTFVGQNPESTKAFVVDQIDPHTGRFDEHKVVLGADTLDQAREIYQSNYAKDWKGGAAITELPMAAFKSWVKDGAKTKPLGDIAEAQAAARSESVKPAAPEQPVLIGGKPVTEMQAGQLLRVSNMAGASERVRQAAAAEIKRREVEHVYAQQGQARAAQEEAIVKQARDEQVSQAVATSKAGEVEAPTAMAAAFESAKRKGGPAVAEPVAPSANTEATAPAEAEQEAPAPTFEFLKKKDGTVTVLGKPAEIKAALPDFKGIPGKRGMTFSRVAAKAVIEALSPKTVAPTERLFKSRKSAETARDSHGNTLRLQKVKGGYRLREKSAAEQEAEATSAANLKRGSRTNVQTDSLLTAIAKAGGLAMAEKADTVGEGNKNVGGKMLFTTNGQPIDIMAHTLAEDGYIPPHEVDSDGGVSWLREAIGEEFAGHARHFSHSGEDWMRQRAEAERGDAPDYEAAGVTDDMLDATGYFDDNAAEQAARDALADAYFEALASQDQHAEEAFWHSLDTVEAQEEEHARQTQDRTDTEDSSSAGSTEGAAARQSEEGDRAAPRDGGKAEAQEGLDLPDELGPAFARGRWYYSELERQIERSPMKAGTAGAWGQYLKGLTNKGVKAEEIAWTGLQEWLELQPGKVTKDQISEYLAGNGVQVSETELPEGDGSQYKKYTLPGGKNYRELLLTMPVDERQISGLTMDSVAKELGYSGWHSSLTDAQRMHVERVFDSQKDRPNSGKQSRPAKYKSSHFDQPNILAHVRIDERTYRDGKRTLFVSEVQSDWGQDGKKKGIASAKSWEVFNPTTREVYGTFDSPEEARTFGTDNGFASWDFAKTDGVPAAPFIGKTEAWAGLAIKRLITYAVEHGFERVAFITGQQAADLYDLSKQVSSVTIGHMKDGTWAVSARTLQAGDPVEHKGLKSIEAVADVVGKDLADKAKDFGPGEYRQFRDVDLKVGGEGMRTFYDQIIPNIAKDVAKKLGGTTSHFGDGAGRQVTIEITPEVRAKVEGGVPLFSRQGESGSTAAPGAGKGSAAGAVRGNAAHMSISKEDMSGVVGTFLEKAKAIGIDNVVMVDNPVELPADIKAAAKSQSAALQEIEGVMHRGKVYLVRSGIRDAKHAEEILFHEVYGHMGAAVVMGGRTHAGLNAIWHDINGLAGVKKIGEKHRFANGDSVWDRLQVYISGTQGMPAVQRQSTIVDELIAHLAQLNDTSALTRFKGYLSDLKKSVVATARKYGLGRLATWLENSGSEMDVLALVRDARNAMATGRNKAGQEIRFVRKQPDGGTVPAFSRSDEEGGPQKARDSGTDTASDVERSGKVTSGDNGSVASDQVSKAAVLQGKPVAELPGNSAPMGYKPLREWASKLFEDAGGKAVNPELGTVLLDARSVRDSMAHGMSPFKAEAFAAVPAVIEKGVVVLTATKGGQDTFYISAPVRIRGVDDVVTVLVRRNPENQRMYLHSVATKEYLLTRFRSRTDAEASEHTGGARSGDVASVLRDLLTFNPADNGGHVEAKANATSSPAAKADASGDRGFSEGSQSRQREGQGDSGQASTDEGDLSEDTGPRFARAPKQETPAESAMRKAGIGPGAKLGDRIRDGLAKAWAMGRERAELADAFQQGALDQFHGINRAVRREIGGLPTDQDPYIAARLANGGTSSVMRGLLMHGKAQWAANGQHLEKMEGTQGLLDILRPLGNDLNEWFGWMVGNRAARLMREGRENNFTADEIKALLALADGRKQEFAKAALAYADFKRSVLDVAQGAGLIDAEGRKVWDNADYIPFYRQMDEKAAFSATGRKGLAGQSSGVRALKGGEAALNDPMENLLMNFSRLIDASLKNNALRSTVDTLAKTDVITKVGYDMTPTAVSADQVRKVLVNAGTPSSVLSVIPREAFEGMAKMWSIKPPTDPDVIRVMRDGKPEFYRVNDPLLLKAVTSFVPFDFPGLGAARWFRRTLTRTVTSTPQFMAANFIRDSVAAQMIARDGFSPAAAIKGVAKAYRETGAGEALLFSGASFQSGNVNAADPTATAKAMRRALRTRGMDALSIDNFMGTILDKGLAGLEKYHEVGEAIENANREAAYEAATKAGKSSTAAAFEAKDMMDFNLRGSSPVYQVMADVLPFFNARVQGLYRLGRADPKRLAAWGVAVMAASLLLGAANDGQDWYEELPDWDKDTYWHIKVGGKHFRIPKPFELGAIFATVPERLARYMKGNDAGGKTFGRVYSNIRDQLAFDVVPQMFRPVLDIWANKDSFRDSPIEGMADEGKLPHLRYSANTSATARAAVGAVAPAADAVGLSPKKLEYLVNGYFGTIGSYALGLSDMAVRAAEGAPAGPSLRTDDLPLVKAFYRIDPARATVFESDLYNMRTEIEQINASVSALRKEGDGEEAKGLATDDKAKLRARPIVLAAAKSLAALNKQRDQVYRDEKMTPEEKRAKLDQIQVRKNAVAKHAMTSNAVKAAL